MSGFSYANLVKNTLVIFPVSALGGTAVEELAKQIPVSFLGNGTLAELAKAGGYAFVGSGTATAIDCLASIAMTQPNGLAGLLFGLAVGEITGAAVEYTVGQIGHLSPLYVATVKSLAAAGSTAAASWLTKLFPGEKAEANERDKLLLNA